MQSLAEPCVWQFLSSRLYEIGNVRDCITQAYSPILREPVETQLITKWREYRNVDLRCLLCVHLDRAVF